MFTAVLNQKSTIIIKQKITKQNAVGINYDYITFQTNINTCNHISLYLILQSNDRVGMYLHLNMIFNNTSNFKIKK